MIVPHKITMDLARRAKEYRVEIMQDDQYSRELEITLKANTRPFVLPEGTTALICYRKKGNVGGMYDTLPNGDSAWRISENVVIIDLTPQICSDAGEVMLAVQLCHEEKVLHTFEICLNVQGEEVAQEEAREDIRRGFVGRNRAVGRNIMVHNVWNGSGFTGSNRQCSSIMKRHQT